MRKDNKLSTDFSPEQFEVTDRNGAEVTLRSAVSGKRLKRNVVHLKKVEPEAGSSGDASEDDEQLQDKEDSSSEELPTAEHQNVPASTNRSRQQPKKFKDYVAYELQQYEYE